MKRSFVYSIFIILFLSSTQAYALAGRYTMTQYQNGGTDIGNLTIAPPVTIKGKKTWAYTLTTYCARENPTTGNYDLITATKTGVITSFGGVRGAGSMYGYVDKDGSTGRIFPDMTWRGNDVVEGSIGGDLVSGHITPDPYSSRIPECP